MPNWTNEQKKAIYEKGSNLLVAAGAGSGKTAVLVERIINKAINENIDIDKLLVVTFTNAAASEMRERVLDAIYKKLEDDPENKNLQRQITLLNVANICTIDSFCNDVVKNNFYELENVSPNFRIADNAEIDLLKQEILDELFEEKYLSEDADFTDLVNSFTKYRDDEPLKNLVLNIYNYILSNPYPRKWLDEKVEMFNIKDSLDKDFSETPWGKILLKEIDNEVTDDIATLEDSISGIEVSKDIEIFVNQIRADITILTALKNSLNNWDKAYELATMPKFFGDWSRKSGPDLKKELKDIRDSVKESFKNKVDKIFLFTSKEANQDIYEMYGTLKKLENLIFEFDDEFSKRKREKNIVDFSDIEHMALNILVKENLNDAGGSTIKYENIVKTDTAKKYAEKFEEIAVDEYQDSNMVQELILLSVSRGNNMFMVGDVKQSIYRFRQAMPKLFLEKYSKYEPVVDVLTEKMGEPENKADIENLPAQQNDRKIQLFKNFRSRNNVLDFTNTIFQDIMSLDLGEVHYNEEEYLNYGAEDYKDVDQNLKTEIDVINLKSEPELMEEDDDENQYEESQDSDDDENSKSDNEHLENIEIEAKYVARKIKKLIDSKYQIYDRKKEKFRDIEYRDIAILLRTTKNKASVYEQELISLDIPVFSDNNQEYLDSIEIQTMMSLLKIIDNPIQDIPLVTVMRSNIGKFTDNELVEIRLSDKYDNFYECLQKAKLSVDDELKSKIEKFLNQLEEWRKEQEYLALDELIWKIYSDTGYYNYVGLMPNGALRQANLKALFEKAKKYETASFKGLYNFINFIEKLEVHSGDMKSAKIIGEHDNVVRIMSIHKSKGLEFPVVFLVNTNKKFNEEDLRKNDVLFHQELGLGPKYINYSHLMKYNTLAREAVKSVVKRESYSEEMRVLYVALTRAKEKLFIIGIVNDFDEKKEGILTKKRIYPKKDGKINSILVFKYKCYLDWILLSYFYEGSSAENIANLNVIDVKKFLNEISGSSVKDADENTENLENSAGGENEVLDKLQKSDKDASAEDVLNELESFKVDPLDVDAVKKEVEYEYMYKFATTIPTKMSVTEIKRMKNEENNANEGIDVVMNSETNSVAENLEIENNVHNGNVKETKFEKPKFLLTEKEEKITPAQKGTLIHLCMQKLNPKEEYTLEKVQKMVENLAFKNIITEKELKAIDVSKVYEFTKSKIWEKLKNAKEYYQEKPFYINVPASEIYSEIQNQNNKENVLVQGIIDLYFIDQDGKLILVDYKTDYVPNKDENVLIEKYKTQLQLYKEALEDALQMKVAETYLYSTYLDKEIECRILSKKS